MSEQPTIFGDSDYLQALYQEMIIDHSQHPHHCHTMINATHDADGFNPLCGDSLKLYLRIENNQIIDASFQGQGCAISTASASLLTDAIIGKTCNEALNLFNTFHELMTTGKPDPTLGKLTVLAGVNAYPMRVKCATLAWHTLQAAIEGNHKPATTE